MLLRHEITDAVEIFSVSGPITDADAPSLEAALSRAAQLRPRGIVVDLSEAGPLSPAALAVLRAARDDAPGWPRAALVVCGLPPELAVHLDAPVRRDRADALAHVDDRSSAPRRRFGCDHAVDSPYAARRAVVEAAGDLSIELLADDLQLVVSELVTNAVRYADPPVEVEIEAGEDTVTVAVVDGSPGRPVPVPATTDAEGGRGLLLIDLMAAETGVRPQPPGKTIWAALPRGGGAT